MKKFGLVLLIATLSLLVVLVAVPVKAEEPTKWECAFTTAASYGGGNEEDRDPSGFKVTPQQFALTFLVVGTKGYLLGNSGASEVEMVATYKGGLQFIERVRSGALQITAIDTHGNAATHRWVRQRALRRSALWQVPTVVASWEPGSAARCASSPPPMRRSRRQAAGHLALVR